MNFSQIEQICLSLAPFPPNLVMPSPSKSHQQNQNHNGSVPPIMLDSLMHFLQHNKRLSSCSATPNPMETFCNATQMPTTRPADNIFHNNFAKNDHEMISNNSTKHNNNNNNNNNNTFIHHANGMETTGALFAKTVDSLHNFLSPNVVLLPVAFHSLADEQHIQLLGMPQTVIPIAIHPAMQKQFAVRPLLVDQTMTVSHQPQQNESSSTTTETMPKHIGIGRLLEDGRECCGGGHLGETAQHFQLPLAFRSTFVHLPTTQQQHQLQQQNNNNNNIKNIVSAMECISHPKIEQHFPASFVDKFGENDDQSKTAEPLDLSLSARNKANENGGGMGTNCATVAGGIHRKKRTNKVSATTEEMCETTVAKKSARKVTPAAEMEALKRTSPSGVDSSLTTSSASSSCIFLSSLGSPPVASSSSAVASSNSILRIPSSSSLSSCASVTLPVLSVDTASRKRFLCEMCGDVSFLAMETLIGHQKYYCRNRRRPDDSSEATSLSSSTRTAIAWNNGKNGGTTTDVHTSIGLNTANTSSSSSPPLASPPSVQCPQCPFQTATNALLSQHQKQQHSLPVVCAECGYRASTVRGLRTHARLSHNSAAEQITANRNGEGGTKHKKAMAEAE